VPDLTDNLINYYYHRPQPHHMQAGTGRDHPIVDKPGYTSHFKRKS